MATTADPRRAPWRARLSVLVATALAVVATVGSVGAVHRSLTSPSAGFVVHSDAREGLRRRLAEASGVSKVCSWYRDNRLRSAC
ncbi:hypothetical protein OOJ91_13400 [Micromonospora lupini]|uniref:hypothetical protein n=1 Tax=Micromonospora lupini TaxID=285679 RepID=UPI00224D2B33|nr:hypothetical protein [Micromonospora lupini]MCX5066842.1 hypothetical protein [Micromonospora lupini]